MTRPFYIAVEGPIGVGKTTLARLLSEALHTELLLEVFEENPFLPRFYMDRERYAFQTQIFFLLSRYRQQREVIPQVLRQRPLVSDYLFAKDRIFAHLNLSGDELAVYEQVHRALAERIPVPDLVVYLKATTDVLMERIAFRDRPYERNMSRDYIEALRQAYENFFTRYTEAPVLTIDTTHLNIVSNSDHREHVIGRVRAALREGLIDQPLPGLLLPEGVRSSAPQPPIGRRLSDWQVWSRQLAVTQSEDLIHAFLTLSRHLGELAAQLTVVWRDIASLQATRGNRSEAQTHAVEAHRQALQQHLAHTLAALLQLANNSGIDLEQALISVIRETAPEERTS